MPAFDTPAPIRATLDLIVGDVRITAADRPDTIVEIRPSDPSSDADVRVAEQTRVEFTDGRLLVKTQKSVKTLGLFSRTGSVDVEIALPSGSQLRGEAGVAAFHCTGTLGETWIKTATGDVHLERTGALEVHTGGGAVVVQSVAGEVRATTATGEIRIGTVTGGVVLKNSNGDTTIDSVGGDLRAKAANGDVVVGQARAGVDAATANGSIRIGAVHHGTVAVRTAAGALEVGIAPGTAAYLDLHTQFGKVLNHLDAAGAPEAGEQNVQVRARTSFGDIIVRRDAGELR